MKNTILITGGTGLLGSGITAGLLRRETEKIYVLIRARNKEAAMHRLKEAWYHEKDLYREIGNRVIPVTGDLLEEDLGLREEDIETLRSEVSVIIHTAAETHFQKSEQELMNVNRDGTARMIALAKTLPHLKRFVHISTAYAAGQRDGLIKEEELIETAYSGFYEKSKAEAEKLVRESGLPYTICRPGMIVGDSKTGRTRNFNTVYYILKLYLLGRLPVLPVGKDLGLNIVPADYVSDAVIRITEADTAGMTFHLTCPEEKQPKAGELAEYVRQWAKKNLDTTLPPAVFMPLKAVRKAGLAYSRRNDGTKRDALSNLLVIAPYFRTGQVFDRTNTDSLLGSYDKD